MPGKIWSISILLLVLGYSTGDAWRLLWYQLDRDSFAERFCENIERPQLECRGSCQLAKLAPESAPRSGAEAPASLLELRLPGPFLPAAAGLFRVPVSVDAVRTGTTHTTHYTYAYAWAPFRPPA